MTATPSTTSASRRASLLELVEDSLSAGKRTDPPVDVAFQAARSSLSEGGQTAQVCVQQPMDFGCGLELHPLSVQKVTEESWRGFSREPNALLPRPVAVASPRTRVALCTRPLVGLRRKYLMCQTTSRASILTERRYLRFAGSVGSRAPPRCWPSSHDAG